MGKKFQLAEIFIEVNEHGEPELYWVYGYGYYAVQSGKEFIYGNSGTKSLERALRFLETKLDEASVEAFLEKVKQQIKESEHG